MSFVNAVDTLNNCRRIKVLAGVNADYPYTVEQVAEAGMLVMDQLTGQNKKLAEELKLVKQQLSAANARAAKQ